VNWIVRPPPGVWFAQMRPPWASTIPRAMVRPRPRPRSASYATMTLGPAFASHGVFLSVTIVWTDATGAT